ncbi:hypothetical protein K492DRAFT_21237 [Lichtheimia hyalospora FSU 10163]|nr:hypothetical protein K492DRAFT_21237 [Lichtheimia hyalospora FSU 10163]
MRQGRRSLSMIAPGAILIAMLISMVGDVLMVQQDQAAEQDDEDVAKTRVALQLQTAGAVMNLVILVMFFVLLASLARHRKGQSVLAIVLATLGGLILIRWIYNSYLLCSMLMNVMQAEDAGYTIELPEWPVFIGLFIVPEILAIALSILYDLTQVKNGVEVRFGFWNQQVQQQLTRHVATSTSWLCSPERGAGHAARITKEIE